MRVYSDTCWQSVTWVVVIVVEGTYCRGLPRLAQAISVLVYPNQGGRYRAEGCMALW